MSSGSRVLERWCGRKDSNLHAGCGHTLEACASMGARGVRDGGPNAANQGRRHCAPAQCAGPGWTVRAVLWNDQTEEQLYRVQFWTRASANGLRVVSVDTEFRDGPMRDPTTLEQPQPPNNARSGSNSGDKVLRSQGSFLLKTDTTCSLHRDHRGTTPMPSGLWAVCSRAREKPDHAV